MAQRALPHQDEAPRYLRAPVPLVFPEEAEVPETRRHLELRTILFQLLFDELSTRATIGSEQFVYFDAGDPRACIAPDAFVKLGQPDAAFGAWKVWERGAPEVALEIVSDSDATEASFQEKLTRYRHLGVREVVRFDARSQVADSSLRVWDRVEGDLVERALGEPHATSLLGLRFVIVPADGNPHALRLERTDGTLVPTRLERIAALQAELDRRLPVTRLTSACADPTALDGAADPHPSVVAGAGPGDPAGDEREAAPLEGAAGASGSSAAAGAGATVDAASAARERTVGRLLGLAASAAREPAAGAPRGQRERALPHSAPPGAAARRARWPSRLASERAPSSA